MTNDGRPFASNRPDGYALRGTAFARMRRFLPLVMHCSDLYRQDPSIESYRKHRPSDRPRLASVAIGPYVWTGRALQAKSGEAERIGLAHLYPARRWSVALLAMMDIRARSISTHVPAPKAIWAT